MSKVIINNGQFKITIPKELALAKGWNKNTILRFIEDTGGNITLKEVKLKK
jgi:bifunctional DNA-binding transcriptional regulator/antitoxin component of YhaV-PrlF toxin-antitoxin module|tara:strand:+ start:154 stop:306 length:153 start_codon:yes stop_codon:yes gene_type:complete